MSSLKGLYSAGLVALYNEPYPFIIFFVMRTKISTVLAHTK